MKTSPLTPRQRGVLYVLVEQMARSGTVRGLVPLKQATCASSSPTVQASKHRADLMDWSRLGLRPSMPADVKF